MATPPEAELYVRWLRKLRKDLHPSGRASELAFHLSKTIGGDLSAWQKRLRDILDGTEKAPPNLVITIEQWRGGGSAPK